MLIPVVFCADQQFILPLQVALVSLLENKNINTEYDVYILHSDDLEVEQVREVIKNYNQKLYFISMGDAYRFVKINNPLWTKTIFYRLSIHKILPYRYRKCVYCDCDVIVNCDLDKLFRTNIEDYYLAGIRDLAVSYLEFRDDFPDISKYINSGVLLINLEKWRKMHIENLFDRYLMQSFRYPDQDILNLVCENKIYIWENDKYVLSGIINGRKYSKIENAIIHYCSLVKPWEVALECPYFKLWTYYAEKIVSNIEVLLKERRGRIDTYLEKKNIYKVVVWGLTVGTLDICYFLQQLRVKVEAIGDNSEQKVKQGTSDFKMIGAKDISNFKKETNFIVVSERFYPEIKQQLLKEGILEEKIMCWAKFKHILYDIS